MARLDQLSNTARDVAQVGAVLGRAFSYALIRAVWPSDEQRLARGLAQLVEAELIFQKGVLPHAREHLQKAVALHNPEHHKALAFQCGTDPRTVCLLYETLALWVLGYPEQAPAEESGGAGTGRRGSPPAESQSGGGLELDGPAASAPARSRADL